VILASHVVYQIITDGSGLFAGKHAQGTVLSSLILFKIENRCPKSNKHNPDSPSNGEPAAPEAVCRSGCSCGAVLLGTCLIAERQADCGGANAE
jgi:hypothetical protein